MTPEPDSAEDRVFVRDATAEDIIAVATIWHTGWRDGHAGHVSAEVAQQRTLADFERRIVARLATIRVATVGDRVVRAWSSSPSPIREAPPAAGLSGASTGSHYL